MWMDIEKWQDPMINWRRCLHQFPELSFQEEQTTIYLIEELNKIGGWNLQRLAETGVIADIQGGLPGKGVALRADIDALPIVEETGLPFSSAHHGIMHACGHDAHTAMLLGAAAWLAENQAKLPGHYRLIFQAAEEVMPGGARTLIEKDVLAGMDYIIGQHIYPELPAGKIGVCRCEAMAAVTDFRVTIQGRGGHAAQPHTALDPIPVAAEIVLAIQRLVARESDPLTPLVVSTTYLHAGNQATNIIPQQVSFGGTIRTFSHVLYRQVAERIREIAESTAGAYGMVAEVDIIYGPIATINDEMVSDLVAAQVQEAFGKDALVRTQPMMAGEDFGAYLAKIPGVFFFLGVGTLGANVYSLHHPQLHVEESAFRYGLETMLRSAICLAKS